MYKAEVYTDSNKRDKKIYPTVATMAVSPLVVPPVADPLVYIVTSALDCRPMFAMMTCWGDCVFQVYLSVTLAPLAQSTQISLEEVPLR